MSEESARLGLPLLAAGQAQKEMTHNEALTQLELLVQAAVEEGPRDVPPDAPAVGACWIVGAAPTDAWSGHAGALAMWTDGGGWRFARPREGYRVWVIADCAPARYAGGGWIVAAAPPAIAAPDGGATIDVEARAAIAAILPVLRARGIVAI